MGMVVRSEEKQPRGDRGSDRPWVRARHHLPAAARLLTVGEWGQINSDLGACWGDEFMGSQRREGPLSKEENLLHLGILREQRGWRKSGHRGQ